MSKAISRCGKKLPRRGTRLPACARELKRWPIKPAIPLAFGLLLLQGVSEAIKRWAVLRGAATAEQLELQTHAEGGDDER